MIKLFECIVGSHSYGTDIETSDTDIKGVYIQPNDDILGFNYTEQIQPDKDTTYFEIRRFIQLLGTANPSVIEMLFTDDKFVLYCHPAFEILRSHKKFFLTKKCKDSFGGMALAQIVKSKGTDKKINWLKDKTERKTPIDFCMVFDNGQSKQLADYLSEKNINQEHCGLTHLNKMKDCYALFHSLDIPYRGVCFEQSNHLRLSSIPKGEIALTMISYNQNDYTVHCRKYKEYLDWLAHKNDQRYTDTLEADQKIDGKNLCHCVRLIDCAEEIAKTKTFSVLRPNREELLNIRKGNINLTDLIEASEARIANLKYLFNSSNLLDSISLEFLHEILIEIRKEFWIIRN